MASRVIKGTALRVLVGNKELQDSMKSLRTPPLTSLKLSRVH